MDRDWHARRIEWLTRQLQDATAAGMPEWSDYWRRMRDQAIQHRERCRVIKDGRKRA